VDVREPNEIKQGGAIPGAIHIPMAQIEKRAGELPKKAEIRLLLRRRRARGARC